MDINDLMTPVSYVEHIRSDKYDTLKVHIGNSVFEKRIKPTGNSSVDITETLTIEQAMERFGDELKSGTKRDNIFKRIISKIFRKKY